jgi:hypothetical protein
MLTFIRRHTATFQAYLDQHGVEDQAHPVASGAGRHRFRIRSIDLVAPREVEAAGEREFVVYLTVVALDDVDTAGRALLAEAICTARFEEGTFRGVPAVRSLRLAIPLGTRPRPSAGKRAASAPAGD